VSPKREELSLKFRENRNDANDYGFIRSATIHFSIAELSPMNGMAKTNSADRQALFVLVTTPRPIGLAAKRGADIILALGGIILLIPFFVICYVAIACFSPGPVLFRHKRVGFNGRQFYCLKFRTMAIDAAERLRRHLEENPAAAAEWLATRKLRNDPRVTAIGALLRKSSLDELPQLFNVLKGDMSIVGPRPVTDEELGRYSEAINAYYACRPGITGLWQVSGRSTTTFQRRVVLDNYYAHHWSMLLDAKIIMATVPAVCFADTAY
jgi:exopolysaccharide production protein ExoY